jgi:hypothetical protein
LDSPSLLPLGYAKRINARTSSSQPYIVTMLKLPLRGFRKSDVRRLMAYIVDLTIIMQILFWMSDWEYHQSTVTAQPADDPKIVIDRARVDRALMIYDRPDKHDVSRVHAAISGVVKKAGKIQRLDRGWAGQKLSELIRDNLFLPAERPDRVALEALLRQSDTHE